MKIDPQSFVLGAITTVVVAGVYHLATSPMRVWIRALLSGAPVPFLTIIGIMLRGNSPTLLIDAYIILIKSGIQTKLDIVEVVYMTDKLKARTPETLAQLVKEQLEQKQE